MNDLSKIIRKLLMSNGFYGLMLVGMRKSFSKDIPTACVSKRPESINVELIIGEEFWGKLKSEDAKVAVLLHELLHIAFMHFDLIPRMPDNMIRGIAVDMQVNQFVPNVEKIGEETGIKPVLLTSYPELKLEPGKGALHYYSELTKARDKKKESAAKGEDSKAGPKGNGKGTSGSKNFDELLDNYQELHEGWKAFEELSEAEQKLVKKQIENELKRVAEQVGKDRGNIPSELAEYISSLFEVKPPAVDWRALFRKMVGKTITNEIKRTRTRENIRFPDSPGMKKKRKIHICMAIDESGSMGQKELEEINNELYHQWKAGAEITVLHWDTEVHAITKYEGKLEIIRACSGGTRASCAIEYINEHRKEFTAAFIGTDGYIENQPIECHVPMMWLITSTGNTEFEHNCNKVKVQVD